MWLELGINGESDTLKRKVLGILLASYYSEYTLKYYQSIIMIFVHKLHLSV